MKRLSASMALVVPTLGMLIATEFGPAPQAQCAIPSNLQIQGHHNPFLAGQAPGTAIYGDTAPGQSPFLVPVKLAGGDTLRFSNVVGNVDFVPGAGGSGPEGEPGAAVPVASALGIAGYKMPANAFLGVFLDASVPAGAAPPALDFSTPASRDFSSLSPDLFQIFFIGDGLRNDLVTEQVFVVPAGATRLFLGSCDGFGWFNNSGAYTFTLESTIAPMVELYCSAKTNSAGCVPQIGQLGAASASLSDPSSFALTASAVLNNKNGLYFYGFAGRADVPFFGGTLCLLPPLRRTPIQPAGGNPPPSDCSGTFAFDFNAWIQAGNEPNVVAGACINGQYWSRDPAHVDGTEAGLTNAVEYTVCP